MPYIKLITITGKTLYQGHHKNLVSALEYAASQGIDLDHIDLSNANLAFLNLDGVKLHDASLVGANLTGANLTESKFTECDFENSVMSDACLCYSDFIECNFKYSSWEGVDLAEATLENCSFSGFSTFYASFAKAFRLHNLTYIHDDKSYLFSSPPTYLKVDRHEVAILDKVMIYNGISHTLECNAPPESMGKLLLQRIQSIVEF